MTRRSAFFLAAVAVPTCCAIFFAMRSGVNPQDYYRACGLELDCEFVPRYLLLAVTALFMAAEGMLVFYALAGSRYWPIWARAGAGLFPLAPVSVVLFFSMMHAPRFHYLHLQWVVIVALALLAIMIGGLIVGLVRVLWEWLAPAENADREAGQ